MKNLSLANNDQQKLHFTVEEDGRAFISLRKAAELLGVNSSSFTTWLYKAHPNVNTSKGLDAKTFSLASTYYALRARKPTKEAKELVEKMTEAGATAFIYQGAGVSFTANSMLSALTETRAQLALTQEKLQDKVNDKIPKPQLKSELMVNLTGNTTLAHLVYMFLCHSKQLEKITKLWEHTPREEYKDWFVLSDNGTLRVKEAYYQQVKDIAVSLVAN